MNTRLRTASVSVALVAVLATARSSNASTRALSFDERVAAQKAIEQLYWNHRIWPKENPGAKPPLSAVMTDDAIRAKVEDNLKKSNALATWWQRPITSDQLQAELDRMAKESRDGRTLQELYRVLGNDPFVIAETLARQTLGERLLRNWYSTDTRFHGGLRAQAEAALAACAYVECMKTMGGEYHETTWRLEVELPTAGERPDEVRLGSDAWKNHLDRLAIAFGATHGSLPIGRLSRLEETAESFIVTAVRWQREDEVATSTVVWPKRSFEDWWNAARGAIGSTMDAPPGSYATPAVPSSACANDTWSATRAEIPDPRYQHTAVWTGTEMIVWGGNVVGSANTNSGGRYNPATDSWTATSTGPNAPDARAYHTAVWTGTQMVVWGGSSGSLKFNTGGRYDPSTDSWEATSTGANVPTARDQHTAVWTGTEMIVWGGYSGASDFNTGGGYNPSTDGWRTTSTGTNAPAPRRRHTAIWTGSRMVVWGGFSGSITYLNTGARYDPSTDGWATTSTGPSTPAARGYHTAVWSGTEMIVWGGYGDSFLATGGRYSPTNDTWIAISTGVNTPSARRDQRAVWTGSVMIVWGGEDGSYLNTGGRYSPSTDAWLATSTGPNVPIGRSAHTAVWTGTEMIVWGGYRGPAGYNTGGRYNPSTDVWTATTTGASVPAARSLHTAVWTGTEMIVWGGLGPGNSLVNTGGRYFPSTDTWAPTALGASVPIYREEHCAVWTGTEMIVWGGYNGSVLDSGGRYSPSTDTWSPISTGAIVPVGRRAPTGVWTGTEMIVWGGYSGASNFNTGGRYNPVTDGWTATSTGANVPSVRSQHTAVWTGTEMIVWGGYDGAKWLRTGGRYSPLTDTWAVTSTGTDFPNQRSLHVAVWTGTQMIVWGGFNNSGVYLNTGWRYDPSADSWTATSTGSNVPSARTQHTAVWTGTEMIVWGGYTGTTHVNSGGRYNPVTDVWTNTSTVSAPFGRGGHSAVWTGMELIVWGSSLTTSSGGRYCACPGGGLAYRDADGDGCGAAGVSVATCDGSIPAGYVADASDCDDADGSIHPGSTETCNGADDNCDLVVDNRAATMCSDGNTCTDDACNGVAGCGHTSNTAPCDDGNACTTADGCVAGSCQGTAGPASPDVESMSASKSEAGATFGWSATVGAISYDALRGHVGDWPIGSNLLSETCFATETAATTIADAAVPATGDGYWYLVRANYSCGHGSYGSQVAHGVSTLTRSSGTCP